MAGRADPRRAHDVDPDVALLADDGLAGVQAHPDGQPAAVRPAVRGEPLLRRDGCCDRVAGAGEGEEERVALCVHLDAVSAAELLAEDRRCVATTSAYRSPSRFRSSVEPSMSVKTKVTVPGDATLTAPAARSRLAVDRCRRAQRTFYRDGRRLVEPGRSAADGRTRDSPVSGSANSPWTV